MTLDEAIKHAEEVAEENQRVVDTGIVFDDMTIDMLYCDDTEVIEEHLANYQKRAEEYEQLAEWLKELKQLREQTRWIPVSERLPENDEDVLVYNDSDIFVAWYSEIVRSWGSVDDRFDENTPIIAWQPLPEPYKGVSE